MLPDQQEPRPHGGSPPQRAPRPAAPVNTMRRRLPGARHRAPGPLPSKWGLATNISFAVYYTNERVTLNYETRDSSEPRASGLKTLGMPASKRLQSKQSKLSRQDSRQNAARLRK